MRYVLENDILRVEIDSFGAEVKSVKNKKEDREYMWYADKKYWGRTSPVLFPFVGSVKNKEFILDGKHYPMGQHGFARDMEHTFVESTEDTIWFELKSNEETMAKYPFEFILKIGYKLANNELKVLWKVENSGSGVLPFSIGAHPAFICPINSEEDKTGYGITFKKMDDTPVAEIHHHGNTRDTGLALTEDIVLPLTDGKCDITPGFFDRCTYMIEGNQVNKVGLVAPDGREFVTVVFDTPLFAIWSPEEKNAPFVCIEPWYGRCDHVDFSGELMKREYTNKIEVGETFEAEYAIIYN